MESHYQHVQARRQYCIQVSRMLGRAIVDVDTGPVQSREMALATAAMTEQDVELKIVPDTYFRNGFLQMLFFLQQMEQVGFDLGRVSTVLEFGCGSARLLRLLRCLADVQLIGTDINPLCIDWCRENIPDATFHINGQQPPLEFLADGSVDLVLAQSVFTHISLELQSDWLREIRRILAPGGLFICTVAGSSFAEQQLDAEELATLNKEGQIALAPDHHRVSWSSRHTRQHDVFQTPERIVEVFGREFEILAFARFWQDVLVLRNQPADF